MKIDEVAEISHLRDGAEISLKYIIDDQRLKPGCCCDAVRAYQNDELVGYLKFDYTTPTILDQQCPTIWSYAQHYTGFCARNREVIDLPLSEYSVVDLADLLKSISGYLRRAFDDVQFNDRQKEIMGQCRYGGDVHVRRADRADLLDMVDQAEKSKLIQNNLMVARFNYLKFHSKPFVAYANTTQNLHTRNTDDIIRNENSGKGVASIMYRATSQWIAERGLAKGLYASGNQSDSAQALWKVFEERGWVTSYNGRKYLDPRKFPKIA